MQPPILPDPATLHPTRAERLAVGAEHLLRLTREADRPDDVAARISLRELLAVDFDEHVVVGGRDPRLVAHLPVNRREAHLIEEKLRALRRRVGIEVRLARQLSCTLRPLLDLVPELDLPAGPALLVDAQAESVHVAAHSGDSVAMLDELLLPTCSYDRPLMHREPRTENHVFGVVLVKGRITPRVRTRVAFPCRGVFE